MALRTPLSVTPHLYMGDSTGRPLDMGTVYFGEQDKDPEFYPIELFSDDALTLPLMQPVHTKGGYLYDKGDMVEPHAKEIIYSVKVLDSYGRKVFYKGAMMRNSWNDDVIEQINQAVIGSADVARQVATDITNEAINNTAVEGGVLADTFVVVDGSLSQRTVNKGLESIAELSTINNPKDGLRVYVKSYHAGLGKGGGYFTYDSSKSSVSNGGTIFNGWVRELNNKLDVHVYHFGAKCDGVNDDTSALQAALNFTYNKGSVELDGTLKLTAPVYFNQDSVGMTVFSESRATLLFNHNGDGLVAELRNFNMGRLSLKNLYIKGPNELYPRPADYVAPSNGTGLKFFKVYDSTLENVMIHGFKTGWSLDTGFNNKTVGHCEIQFNQYGIIIGTGGYNMNITNINIFEGLKIRENHKIAVTINGAGDSPTGNKFIGCYIESNTPTTQDGGRDNIVLDGTESVAVKLNGAYGTVFENCYFENHAYDFYITGNSSRNRVINCSHDGANNSERYGRIYIKGQNCLDNLFENNIYPSVNSTYANRVQITIDGGRTIFRNNNGYLVDTAEIISGQVIVDGNSGFAFNHNDVCRGEISIPDEGVLDLRYGTGTTYGRGVTNSNFVQRADGRTELVCRGRSVVYLYNGIQEGKDECALFKLTGTPNSIVVLIVASMTGEKYTIPYSLKAHGAPIQLSSSYGKGDLKLHAYLDSATFFIDRDGKAHELSRATRTDEMYSKTQIDSLIAKLKTDNELI